MHVRGCTRTISFFHFHFVLDGDHPLLRFSVSAEMFQAAGIIFNVAFGQ